MRASATADWRAVTAALGACDVAAACKATGHTFPRAACLTRVTPTPSLPSLWATSVALAIL
eukprot:4200363-Alexandrium_andersonii.AAC.1